MLLIEYLKRMLGESTDNTATLLEDEAAMLIREHIISDPAGEDIPLTHWGKTNTLYKAQPGFGCWHDGWVEVFVNGELVSPDDYQLDNYLGEVTFNSPLPDNSTVHVHTWRVNFSEALSRALLWLANDFARNAVKTELDGVSCDFTNVAKELRQQAMQVQSHTGPVKLLGNDFPH